MDPLAEDYFSQSTYSYGFNNPIRYTDFMGMGPEDKIIKTNSEITNITTDKESGITRITEVTTTVTTSKEVEINDDRTIIETTTTATTNTTTSTTEINSKGEIVSNNAISQTTEKSNVTKFSLTEFKTIEENTTDRVISGPSAVKDGYIGNKTEAIAVIAVAGYEEKTGPWYTNRGMQDIITGITAPVTAPANPGLQNRTGWGGVRHNSDGNYSREDSMRMRGKYYNGPKTDTSSRYHKAIYKKNKQ